MTDLNTSFAGWRQGTCHSRGDIGNARAGKSRADYLDLWFDFKVTLVSTSLARQMAKRVEIDCSIGDTWEALLEATILKGWEADLINFDFKSQGPVCARIAERRNVEFIPQPEKGKAKVRRTG